MLLDTRNLSYFCSNVFWLCVFLLFHTDLTVGFDVLNHFLMQAAVSVKALEKQLQQKKDSDPIMAGILEEVRHIILYTLEYHVPLW